MAQPFKFRYVNEIVGVFVLIGLGFVIAGVVTALKAQGWLLDSEQTLRIKIELPEEGSLGLKPGDSVRVLGTVIGQVDSVTFNEQTESMQATVSVRGSLISYLRDNSIPVIHASFALGSSYIEIIKNPLRPGQPLPQTDAHLWYSRAAGGEADAMLREYTALAADLRDPNKPLQQAIAHVSEITRSISQGEGLVGRLLVDKKTADQITVLLPKLNEAFDAMSEVLGNLRKTSGNLADVTGSAKEDVKRLPAMLDTTQNALVELQATLRDIRKTTEQLPKIIEGAGVTVSTLPGVVLQLQETLRQIQILVEGIQKSWLVRSYIEKPETTGRIRAEEIGK